MKRENAMKTKAKRASVQTLLICDVEAMDQATTDKLRKQGFIVIFKQVGREIRVVQLAQ